MRSILTFTLLVTSCFSINAQNSQLTLDRIFNSKDFRNERFGPARWTEGGKAYTTLEASTTFPEQLDIIEYQANGPTVPRADLWVIPEGKPVLPT